MGFCVIWISKLKQVALGRRMPKAAPTIATIWGLANP